MNSQIHYSETLLGELATWVERYQDSAEFHIAILNAFRLRCLEVEHLRRHREYVEEHNRRGLLMGHGDRSVQYLFSLLVEQMPPLFRFLEIGVYKGQICSLIELLSKVSGRECEIVGITPLIDVVTDMGTGQKPYNRAPFIEKMYRELGLSMERTRIIDGLSQNPEIRALAAESAPFDILYIDGDHSYKATVADIEGYKGLLRPGGFLVIDDASSFKQFPKVPDPVHQAPLLFTGIKEVSQAVRDVLEVDPNFAELLTCMHVRLFQRRFL